MPESTNRVVRAITGTPWAIMPDALENILTIAERGSESIEAVEARLGRRLDNTRSVTVRNGVAIIPVVGPIARYFNLFSAISGGTSIQVLATDFTTALENPDVQSILFEIDSPGGAAMGLQEFADMIFNARGQKPMKAYISGYGASAAYWIASAVDEVVAAESSIVGSIGVVTAWQKPDANTIEIVSSRAPNKRPDVSTDAGRAQIQTIVDSLESIFIKTVARNRNISEQAVVNDFGQGGVFVGQAAVDAGLVDRLGTLEGLISELAGGQPNTDVNYGGKATMSTQNPAVSTQQTPAPAVAANETPAVPAAVPAAAAPAVDPVQAAIQAERARILAIDEATLPGNEALAAKAKADGVTAGEFAIQQIVAQKQVASAVLKTLEAEAPKALPQNASAEADPEDEDETPSDGEGQESAVDEKKLKANWNKDAKLRTEFSSFESYKGYQVGLAKGRIKA